MSTAAWIVVALLVLVCLWLMMTYNGLVTLRQRCRQAFSDILLATHPPIDARIEAMRRYAGAEQESVEAARRRRGLI